MKIKGEIDIGNLWRCVKHHCGELQRELDWLLVSREQFFDAKAQLDIRGLTDIQRAARFFFLIKSSFGSDRRSFGISTMLIRIKIILIPFFKSFHIWF